MAYKIQNDCLSVGINEIGGCLSSIYDKREKEEYLYQPEPDSWQGQDVAIFPFIARLKGKTYTHKGNTYSMRNHGLCRYYPFSLLENKGDSITLSFSSNEETLKEYPFPFEFKIRYSLEGNTLRIEYTIINTGEETMPFGLGAHPAFKLDGERKEGKVNTDGNFVYLSKPTQLTRVCLDEKGEFVIGEEDYGIKEKLEATKQLVTDYQTLCVKGEGIEDVTLVRKSGKKLHFHFDNINYLVLWSFETTGNFVALEPWMSLPDFNDCPREIAEKKTLLHLNPGETYHFSYSIQIG